MSLLQHVHVSSHTGSVLLGWDTYAKGRYRALDPHTLRLLCSNADRELSKEQVAQLLLSILAKYGQIVSSSASGAETSATSTSFWVTTAAGMPTPPHRGRPRPPRSYRGRPRPPCSSTRTSFSWTRRTL
jgi:hypothetical protein